jgi:hypothetical protein
MHHPSRVATTGNNSEIEQQQVASTGAQLTATAAGYCSHTAAALLAVASRPQQHPTSTSSLYFHGSTCSYAKEQRSIARLAISSELECGLARSKPRVQTDMQLGSGGRHYSSSQVEWIWQRSRERTHTVTRAHGRARTTSQVTINSFKTWLAAASADACARSSHRCRAACCCCCCCWRTLAEQCDHTFTVPQEPAALAGLQRRPVSYLQRASSAADLNIKLEALILLFFFLPPLFFFCLLLFFFPFSFIVENCWKKFARAS